MVERRVVLHGDGAAVFSGGVGPEGGLVGRAVGERGGIGRRIPQAPKKPFPERKFWMAFHALIEVSRWVSACACVCSVVPAVLPPTAFKSATGRPWALT